MISDDCSKDGTTEVIRRYLEMFPNIISLYIRKKINITKEHYL
ncbi:MAG: hypothetical protein AB8V03_01575 [Francisella endosymbiont of Hyalomma asiaticum]